MPQGCCLLVLLCIFYSYSSARSIPTCIRPDLVVRADDAATEPSAPEEVLRRQYTNPAETLSVLLLIGGDIVQKAIAQVVGRSRITPVAFSFGWVTYAFTALVSAFGDGTLMPLPDFPCKVINLETGNTRQNESWVIGRLLRDLELQFDKELKLPETDRKPIITILKTCGKPGQPEKDLTWWSAWIVVPVQLIVAAIPAILPRRNWTILLVTAMGTLLATVTSSLPQWANEKFQCRTNSKACYVITRGNGHQHIFVIQNGRYADGNRKEGISLNLEDLAVATPATTTLTKILTPTLALLWVFLLITVGGLKRDAWFLLGVGGLGMVHNVWVASHKRSSAGNGVPLDKRDIRYLERKDSTMKILQEGEKQLAGLGLLLKDIFFPGNLSAKEAEYWKEQRDTLSSRQEKLQADLKAIADVSHREKSPVVTTTENASGTTTASSRDNHEVQDQTTQTTLGSSNITNTATPAHGLPPVLQHPGLGPQRSNTAPQGSNLDISSSDQPAVSSGVDGAAAGPIQRSRTFNVPTSTI